jgi:hypothetical protein
MVQTFSKSNKFWSKFLSKENVVHDQISCLDPLHFDEALHLVHQLNRDRNIDGLVCILYEYLPKPGQIRWYRYNESIAIMRDLGMLLGSIKRLGYEPVKLVPELESVLVELGEKTNMPPRDTLFHYTIWNPTGSRIRTYTGSFEEINLVKSMKLSYRQLTYAIYLMIEMHNIALDDSYFKMLCLRAESCFQGMVSGISDANQQVYTTCFANELQHYADPITVRNTTYIGPGTFEMPVFVYDHLLWSSDTKDEVYKEFKTTYLPFNMGYLREVYYNYDGKTSIVSRMLRALRKRRGHDQLILSNNASALLNLCVLMKHFRMPDSKTLLDAGRKKLRMKPNGTSAIDMISHVIALNTQQISVLESTIDRYQRRTPTALMKSTFGRH